MCTKNFRNQAASGFTRFIYALVEMRGELFTAQDFTNFLTACWELVDRTLLSCGSNYAGECPSLSDLRTILSTKETPGVVGTDATTRSAFDAFYWNLRVSFMS